MDPQPTTYDYHKRRMRPEALINLKEKIEEAKKRSSQYAYEINRWEAAFIVAFKNRPPADMGLAVSYQAQFEAPLLSLKDHADFTVGLLEGMLPDEEKPYHPQEPDSDPFAHVRRRFR